MAGETVSPLSCRCQRLVNGFRTEKIQFFEVVVAGLELAAALRRL